MTTKRRVALILATLSLLLTAVVTAATDQSAEARQASSGIELQWSLSGDRSDAQPLDGAVLPSGSDVAIFLATGDEPVQWVTFFLGNSHIRTEFHAPFDYLGTRSDGTASLTSFSEGDYHVAAWFKSGYQSGFVGADFSVAAAPVEPTCSTIAEIAIDDPNFSTLVTALTAATNAGGFDFLGAVTNPDADLTVFAPTNAAFAALDPAVLDAALADPAGLLTTVLAYHVLGTSETGNDLAAAGSATTLAGPDVTINVDTNGDLFINDSLVVLGNVDACNGIVHVINNVLLPPAPPAPETPVIADGNVVLLRNVDKDRYLDADRYNVDLGTTIEDDNKWQLEQLDNGNYRLRNVAFGRYLDADNVHRRWNVDLNGWANARGVEWEFIDQGNGVYALRAVDFDRYLDGDWRNVDTSSSIRSDDLWEVTLAD